nr:MAG TPA: hypothetical protein [Caudoviricetes sp.]DAY49123.1 MAG TPA: hypothetical protein [Caudoviricetes sp.]
MIVYKKTWEVPGSGSSGSQGPKVSKLLNRV